MIFHLFTAHMIPVFIYPALLNHFTLLAPFLSPPSSSTQAGDFLCFLSCPDLSLLFFPPCYFLHSLWSPRLPRSCFPLPFIVFVFSTHVLPWSSPLYSSSCYVGAKTQTSTVSRAHTRILRYVCMHTHPCATESKRKGDHALFAEVNTLPEASAVGNESFHLWDIECAFMDYSVHAYCLRASVCSRAEACVVSCNIARVIFGCEAVLQTLTLSLWDCFACFVLEKALFFILSQFYCRFGFF